jgi:hypothetical protein
MMRGSDTYSTVVGMSTRRLAGGMSAGLGLLISLPSSISAIDMLVNGFGFFVASSFVDIACVLVDEEHVAIHGQESDRLNECG